MHLQKIQQRIYEVREQKAMLDFDLAELYETETKRLKEALTQLAFYNNLTFSTKIVMC